MIRYELPEPIDRLVPGDWQQKAAIRIRNIIAAGTYKESSAIWSDIKPIYMDLQSNKCMYCERQFASKEYGRIEHDLEHYRPKNPYHWLAYDIENYGASCKICNSTLKSNDFPIDLPANRGRPTQPIRKLNRQERPLLCYPIGRLDVDPEKLITFEATVAVPVGKRGYKHKRGERIISFFKLNDRDELHRERAQMIILLGYALEKLNAGVNKHKNAEVVNRLISGVRGHTACLRAFYAKWHKDQTSANQIFQKCLDIA